MAEKTINDFKVSTEMTLGEYVKLTEKPETKEEREVRLKKFAEWRKKADVDLKRAMEAAIKEEEA